jgi:hypothetical protein
MRSSLRVSSWRVCWSASRWALWAFSVSIAVRAAVSSERSPASSARCSAAWDCQCSACSRVVVSSREVVDLAGSPARVLLGSFGLVTLVLGALALGGQSLSQLGSGCCQVSGLLPQCGELLAELLDLGSEPGPGGAGLPVRSVGTGHQLVHPAGRDRPPSGEEHAA